MLFLNFLHFQLGFGWEEIIRVVKQLSLGGSLDNMYYQLIQPSTDSWPDRVGLGRERLFSILNATFPKGTAVALTNNKPFPLLAAPTWRPGRT